MLFGGLGADTINGGNGNDTISGGAGGDFLDGGEGLDTLSYAGSAGNVTVNLAVPFAHGGDAQGDTITNFENARGGNGDDDLTGDAEANTLWGGAGVDTLRGAGGNDTIIGGADGDVLDGEGGVDTVSYAGSKTGVSVNLTDQTVSGGDASGDTIANFENATGSDLSDWILGNDGSNRLIGSGGFDFIDGRGGNDRLTGGAQSDTFVFGAGYGHDTITDFTDRLNSFETVIFGLGEAFDTFAEVVAVAQASGANQQHTVFRFDANTSLTLLDVKSFQLTADNFQFV